MSLKWPSLLVLLGSLGACGSIPMEEEESQNSTYQAQLVMSPPANFGGAGTYVCRYTMTLRQIQLELVISPEGQVLGGSAQNMTDEKVTNTGECPFLPAMPTMQKFRFLSATPVGNMIMVVMEGDITNAPKASLGITLAPTSGGFASSARWTRTDQVPELTWTVTATMTLETKPATL